MPNLYPLGGFNATTGTLKTVRSYSYQPQEDVAQSLGFAFLACQDTITFFQEGGATFIMIKLSQNMWDSAGCMITQNRKFAKL